VNLALSISSILLLEMFLCSWGWALQCTD